MAKKQDKRKKISEKKSTSTLADLTVSSDNRRLSARDPGQEKWYQPACFAITLVAFIARFYYIWYPDEVVFDEVHFGKFASYYIQRTYFFDLHPPFAKLLIALVGWACGYDGHFKFDRIGDSYLTHAVPYIPLRSFEAILGTLTVPLMFNTLKESGYSVAACIIGSALVAIDNAHVAETRLILLDATLIISVAASLYCYVRFCKLRHTPFTNQWYTWLFLTGVSLSCVISTKYVGVLTFAAIGAAVAYDLWQLLDIKKGVSDSDVFKHIYTRIMLLIVVPFLIYLFWFWVHFAVLTKSGPGDSFMSSEFQETLQDSPLAREARTVNFYDTITLRHKDTKCLLHSHEYRYPLRYDDGRVSSQGQQVTCMSDYNDTNNYWQILPVNDFVPGKQQAGHAVLQGSTFRLKHVATNGYLLAHDVASPLMSTNEEFTVIPVDELGQKTYVNDTLFRFDPFDTAKNDELKTKASVVKLLHVPTVVAMWTHNDKLLPDWGFNQQEVNGNKNLKEDANYWTIDTIVGLSGQRAVYVPKKVKTLPFLKKWWELQFTMFEQNNKLTSEHPFASQPEEWPMCMSGVSFWTKNESREQIFFVGNIPGWWFECIMISAFIAIATVDLVTRRRGINMLAERARSKFYLNAGFFLSSWVAHYFPFFLMHRQKFLHHYLPAHLSAALFSGALIEFLFTDNRSPEFSKEKEEAGKLQWKPFLSATVGILSVLLWGFIFFAPITYGNETLNPEQVQERQWMNLKLHFAKW